MTLPEFITLLAQAPTRPDKGRLLFESWWLWVGLLLLGLIVIRIVGSAAAARRRKARLLGEAQRKKRAIKDAWAEAGKRVEAVAEEPDDEDEESAR